MQSKEASKDEGWSWVVMLASFTIIFISETIQTLMSVCMVRYSEHFNADTADVGMIPALHTGSQYLATIPAAMLIEACGCEITAIIGGLLISAGLFSTWFATSISVLYIGFGIVAGVAQALICTAATAVIYKYFEKKKGLASGILMCGYGAPYLAVVPVLHLGLDQFGWKGIHLILSGVSLNICVCALLFRDGGHLISCYFGLPKLKTQEHVAENGATKTMDNCDNPSKPECDSTTPAIEDSKWSRISQRLHLSIFQTCDYVIYALSQVWTSVSVEIVYRYIVAKTMSEGFTEFDSSIFLSVMGTAYLMSQLLLSLVADCACVRRIWMCGVSELLSGLVLFLYPHFTSYASYIVMNIIYGIMTGGIYVEKYTVIVDILGAEHIALAAGWMNTMEGVGVIIGVPRAGHLFDKYGANGTFYMAAICGVLSGVFGCCVAVKRSVCSSVKAARNGDVEVREVDALEEDGL